MSKTPADHPKFLYVRRFACDPGWQLEQLCEKEEFDDEQVDEAFRYAIDDLERRLKRLQKKRNV